VHVETLKSIRGSFTGYLERARYPIFQLLKGVLFSVVAAPIAETRQRSRQEERAEDLRRCLEFRPWFKKSKGAIRDLVESNK
jgi:hypothetical protein